MSTETTPEVFVPGPPVRSIKPGQTLMDARRTVPINSQHDPYMTVKKICEVYDFLTPRGIYRLRDLGHFPKHDGRAGRRLLWRQSTIGAWFADGMPQVTL